MMNDRIKFILLFLSILLPCVIYAQPNVGKIYNIDLNSQLYYFNSTIVFGLTSETSNNVYLSWDSGMKWENLPIYANLIYFNENPPTALLYEQTTQFQTSTTLYMVDQFGSLTNTTVQGNLRVIQQHQYQSNLLSVITNTGNATVASNLALYSQDFGNTWSVMLNEGTNPVGNPVWNLEMVGIFMKIYDNTTNSFSVVYTPDYFVHSYPVLQYVSLLKATKTQVWAFSNTDGFFILDPNPTPVIAYSQDGSRFIPNSSIYVLDDSQINGVYIATVDQLNDNSTLNSVFHYDGEENVFDFTFEGLYIQDFFPDFMTFDMPGFYALNSIESANSTLLSTQYTIDSGANWNSFSTADGSQLNFYGYVGYTDSNVAPLYANPYSLGMVIGNGVTGNSFNISSSNLNIQTYITRNSGSNWTVLYENQTMFEFGNYGNFIVFVPVPNPQNLLFYTIDQGLTIQNLSLPAAVQGVDIFNIVTDPDNTNLVFTFIYYPTIGNTTQGLLFSIDFGSLYPECGASDFEVVSVHGSTDDPATTCVDGTEIYYYRRLQASQCLATTAPSQNQTTTCQCTESDFECDNGYIRVKGSPSLKCILPNGASPSTQPPNFCPAGTNYTVTNGYKRIFGDNCIGGVENDYAPSSYPCPAASSSDQSSSTHPSDSSSTHPSDSSSTHPSDSSSTHPSDSSSTHPSDSSSSQPSTSSTSTSSTSSSSQGPPAPHTSGSFDGNGSLDGTGSGSSFPPVTSSGHATTGVTSGTSSGSAEGSQGYNSQDSFGSNSNNNNNQGKNNGSQDSSKDKKKADHKGLVVGLILGFIVMVALICFVMYRFPNLRMRFSKMCRGNEYTYSKLTNDSDYLIYEDGDDETEDL